MKRRWRSRALTAALALLLVAGVGVGIALGKQWLSSLWASDPIPTLTVAQERFVRTITAEGNLRAVKATPLVAPPEARGPLKIAWLADDGSRVTTDDLVVRFDATDMEKKLEDGLAAQDTADSKIRLERVQVGSTLRDRDRAAQMAERELDQTRQFQSKDELIFSRNQIIESAIDGELSEARMTHAGAAKTVESSVSRSKLDLLAIEKRAAQLKIEEARRGLQSLELRAPHDGIVVFRRDWRGNQARVGETVWSGQALAEIPLTANMEAEVFVLEADAGGLEAEKSAEVVIESNPSVTHTATVARVDTLAKPRVRGVPVQYFAVTLSLAETETDTMKPGQRVRAQITLDDRDAMVVPRQAVIERGEDQIVYRRGDDGWDPVVVTLGPSTPGRVVIESGLSEGDVIALRDPTRPADSEDEGGAQGGGQRPGGPTMGAP